MAASGVPGAGSAANGSLASREDVQWRHRNKLHTLIGCAFSCEDVRSDEVGTGEAEREIEVSDADDKTSSPESALLADPSIVLKVEVETQETARFFAVMIPLGVLQISAFAPRTGKLSASTSDGAAGSSEPHVGLPHVGLRLPSEQILPTSLVSSGSEDSTFVWLLPEAQEAST
jgi:hypothetical protein